MVAGWIEVMRILAVMGVIGIIGGVVGGQRVWGAEKTLRFNAMGKFKIVQFTDTHFTEQNEDLKEEQAKKVGTQLLQDIATILDQEKPDLVVFTGDNVLTPRIEYWKKLVEPMEKRGIAWTAVMGNHDYEKTGKTRKELMKLVSTFPHSLGQCGPENLGGGGNYVLQIKGANDSTTKAVLYFLDSGDYAHQETLGQYAWISFEQIAWFREQCAAMTAGNHNKPVPSLAFFHIPVPEYYEVGDFGTALGEKNEAPCSPKLNSGFFTTLIETKSVMGCFVGHDHVNDLIGNVRGICLGYGRKTGSFSYHKMPSGGRVIEMLENQPKFNTWIRTGDGKQEELGHWPEDFMPKPKAK